ncbi:MAG: glycoside hydrolase family 57 protein [Deltaproteobacteria bacterium]|nr:glycoside hydrolase family 57 protein [Deltaproteobacteria bacterium]
MSSVVFYFQVHQPFRLRRYSYFESTRNPFYFDDDKNRQILEKVAHKCYLPTNDLILKLIKRGEGRFKVSYSITGVAIEQMRNYCSPALESFVKLAETGCVEFLAETYYHSLASIHDSNEFLQQITLHSDLIHDLFGQKPSVFRNTELIYSDHIGSTVAELGFKGVIAEGADDILGWRSPNFVYSVAGQGNGGRDTRLLLKNYRLSDDVAFRFSNRGWPEFPLTADKFASWIHRISGAGEIVNLFMDYETFGEHQWESTGIFQFLEHLPEAVARHPDWDFCTPSEAIERYSSFAEIPFGRVTSWADVDRDVTAWQGNRMQISALKRIYELGDRVKQSGDEALIDTWRKLLTSDHFYYMCTKWFADGDVHAYFSPFDSPYDAFINYMNVMRDFESRLGVAPLPLADVAQMTA